MNENNQIIIKLMRMRSNERIACKQILIRRTLHCLANAIKLKQQMNINMCLNMLNERIKSEEQHI